jgi:4-oxalocrotonate tautomerase
MPVIKVEISKQTDETKKEIIARLTKTVSEVTKIPEQAFTILINEYDKENIGVGGIQLSERIK